MKKKRIISLMFLFILVIVPKLYGAEKILDYGFENWGGSISNTPGYPCENSSAEYCTMHTDATEVVQSYNEWTPHSGSYFLLQNDSNNYALDPPVGGITQGTVNAHNNFGYDGNYCGDRDLYINVAIIIYPKFI